jgi:hypothetical protein
MTRHGKIARLPHMIREQINRRLQDSDEGREILEWLNALPEVKTVMDTEFDGQPVSKMNLSNWRLGGYRDWEAQQEALAAVRQSGANAAEINQEAGGQLADQLAICVTARIAVALQKPPSTADDPAAELLRLRQLCADLVALRKGDHNAMRLRIEREKLDLELKRAAAEEALRNWEIEEAKNPRKRCITREMLKKIEEEFHIL